jgi:hypothetical protein
LCEQPSNRLRPRKCSATKPKQTLSTMVVFYSNPQLFFCKSNPVQRPARALHATSSSPWSSSHLRRGGTSRRLLLHPYQSGTARSSSPTAPVWDRRPAQRCSRPLFRHPTPSTDRHTVDDPSFPFHAVLFGNRSI